MSKAKELYDALRTLSRQDAATFPGTVVELSGDTVDVEVAGVVYFDVQLRSITDSLDGLLIMPEIGSTVLIQQLGNSNSTVFYVCMYSKIKGIQIKTGSSYFKQEDEGFVFGRNNDTLLKVLTDLISVIRTIYAPLDHSTLSLIENRITQLLK